ncbi:MAG: hypothetical protein EAZ08_00345 [Cytophagales bacterium]|nr:MAG: hypothetical protein EAZ08_00345 [Cytophagales bacterium]
MHKNIKTIYFLSAFLIITLFIGFIYLKIENLKVDKIYHFPSFNFYDLDSISVNLDKNTLDKLLMIVHFNSECGSCHYQLYELINYQDSLTNVNVILVSEENISTIRHFKQQLKLEKSKFTVLRAANHSFYNIFGNVMTPSIFIYSSDKKLIKIFKGETQIKAILKHIP